MWTTKLSTICFSVITSSRVTFYCQNSNWIITNNLPLTRIIFVIIWSGIV